MVTFPKVMSYLLAALIGTYAAKQFIYHEPIEGYRWLLTGILFIYFHTLSVKDKKD